jgi:hypothetical protein
VTFLLLSKADVGFYLIIIGMAEIEEELKGVVATLFLTIPITLYAFFGVSAGVVTSILNSVINYLFCADCCQFLSLLFPGVAVREGLATDRCE